MIAWLLDHMTLMIGNSGYLINNQVLQRDEFLSVFNAHGFWFLLQVVLVLSSVALKKYPHPEDAGINSFLSPGVHMKPEQNQLVKGVKHPLLVLPSSLVTLATASDRHRVNDFAAMSCRIPGNHPYRMTAA